MATISCPTCSETISARARTCPHCGEPLAGSAASSSGDAKSGLSTGAWVGIVIGVSLVLLVGCGGIMAALLLPAVQQARVAARSTMSKNNLKQMALATHNFHDVHNEFPPGTAIQEQNGNQRHSWQTHMLPYIDSSPLYESVRLDLPWDDPANQSALSSLVPAYHNPSLTQVTRNGYALSHYAGNVHVLSPDKTMRMRDVTDGLSNTILAGEVTMGFRPWGDPDNLRDPADGLTDSATTFFGPARGVTMMLTADGAVHAISHEVSPSILKALATPNGGETVGDY